MLQTTEAIIDEKGTIHWLEKIELKKSQKILITFLEETVNESYPLKNSIVYEDDIVSPIDDAWNVES